MKRCTKCGETKPYEAFRVRLSMRDGRRSQCRCCENKQTAAKHKERYWSDEEYRNKIKAKSRKTKSSPEYHHEYNKKLSPLQRRRYAAVNHFTNHRRNASWDENFTRFITAEAAELALLRTEQTGIAWEIDHIVPFKGKNVSGLHVWNNLQVIPMVLNRRKFNTFEG